MPLLGVRGGLRSSFSSRNDRDKALVVLAPAELYDAIGEGVQSVVLADSDVQSGVVLGAALANENVTRDVQRNIWATVDLGI